MVVIINGFYQSDFMNKLTSRPQVSNSVFRLASLGLFLRKFSRTFIRAGKGSCQTAIRLFYFKHKKNQDYCEVRQLRTSVVCADQIETPTLFFFPCSLQTQTRSKATDALKNRYNLKSLTFKNTTQVQRRHFVCQRIAHNGSLGGAFDRQI